MKRFLIIFLALMLTANVAIWQAVFVETRDKKLTVAFLDVGQGDAIFIEAPNGNQIVVDGGPNAKVLGELGRLMPWYDKSIDMIVATNPDKDHIAGLVDILKRYKVSYFLEPGTENKTLVNGLLHDLVTEKHVEKLLARRGMEIFLDENVVLTVLFPDRDVAKEKSNDGSIVMRLKYGETEVMLTGDAPSDVENHILVAAEAESRSGAQPNLENDMQLKSDVLKIGHHGSKTSTSEEFVTAVSPDFAVISSGKGNKYGHPHDEVLATLGKFPLKILRTDELGSIVMTSDGKNFSIRD